MQSVSGIYMWKGLVPTLCMEFQNGILIKLHVLSTLPDSIPKKRNKNEAHSIRNSSLSVTMGWNQSCSTVITIHKACMPIKTSCVPTVLPHSHLTMLHMGQI